jgi:WD40 repeat protein/outer membrane protein assembly factor BamE (lipoprotein component of BamABCDE complex)
MGIRDLLQRAVSVCLVLVAAGCVAHFPPPAVKVQEKELRFLQLGTTRDEVLQRLGQPNILSTRRFSVYEWLSATGSELVVAGYAGGGGFTGRNQSRLLVEFDDAGKLRHFAVAEYHHAGGYFGLWPLASRSAEAPQEGYFVDGSARELPGPTASLLRPDRSLAQFPGIWRPAGVQAWPLTLSRDGRYVAAPSTNGIRVWDLSTGGYRTIVAGLKLGWGGVVGDWPPHSIDISNDSKVLAAGFDDAVVLWDMASGERLHVLGGHGKSSVFGGLALEFGPDGRTLATGGRDDTVKLWEVKLWDVASGKETSSFPIGRDEVQSLAFAPGGDLLAVGTARGVVIVIDLMTDKQAKILDGSDEFEWSRTIGEEQSLRAGRKVAFSPSGGMLAVSDCVAVQLWRVSDIREQFESLAAAGRPSGADQQHEPSSALLLPYGKQPGCRRGNLAFAPEEDVLVARTNSYSVWDLRSRRLVAAWDPPGYDEPADLTLGAGAALLAWNDNDPLLRPRGGIQIVDLARIIREAREEGQRAGSEGTAK